MRPLLVVKRHKYFRIDVFLRFFENLNLNMSSAKPPKKKRKNVPPENEETPKRPRLLENRRHFRELPEVDPSSFIFFADQTDPPEFQQEYHRQRFLKLT